VNRARRDKSSREAATGIREDATVVRARAAQNRESAIGVGQIWLSEEEARDNSAESNEDEAAAIERQEQGGAEVSQVSGGPSAEPAARRRAAVVRTLTERECGV